MSFRKRIKDKLNQELPYSPSYNEFAEMAGITPKERRRAPIYRSVKRRVLAGALVSVAAVGVVSATIPAILLNQNAPIETDVVPHLRYRPEKLTRSITLTEKTEGIYANFVKAATANFFTMNQSQSESQSIYLPDLFFSCSMLATISGESIQNSFLEVIGAESISQLKAASKELASYLVFLDLADEAGESDYGSFGLSGFFYDSSSRLKSGYDEHLQEFSKSFNAYSFSSKPTKEILAEWQKYEDENDYLSEELDRDYADESKLSIVSSSKLFDAFSYEDKSTYWENYMNGYDMEPYSYNEDEEREIDFLHLAEKDGSVLVERGQFQLLSATINKTEIEVFLPDYGVDVDTFAPTIFDYYEEAMTPISSEGVAIPMFSIKKSMDVTADTLFDFFKGGELASAFLDETDASCSLSQNNSLKFDYNGLEGNSNKPENTSTTFSKPFNNIVSVARPFVFSISYEGIDLYYGKVHDPDYPAYTQIASE